MADILKENYTNLKISKQSNMEVISEALIDEGYIVSVQHNKNNTYSIISYKEVHRGSKNDQSK